MPQVFEFSISNLTFFLERKLWVFFSAVALVGSFPGVVAAVIAGLRNRRFLMCVRPSMSISYDLLLRLAMIVASIVHLRVLKSWTTTASPGCIGSSAREA